MKQIIPEKSSEKLAKFLKKNSLHKRDFAEMIGVTLSYVYNLIDENVSRYEKEADLFASFFLAPADSFLESYYEFYGRYNNKLDVAVSLQQKFGMSHLAVLTRLKQEKLISSKEYEKYSYEKPLVNALQLGYSKDLYLPTNENKTVGKYIRLTMKLKNNNKKQDKIKTMLLTKKISWHYIYISVVKNELYYFRRW